MTTDKALPLTVHRMAAWRGQTGRAYAFWAYALDEAVPAFPGIFAFAAPDASLEGWRIVLLGESENFERTLRDDGLRKSAEAQGATHILLYCQGGSAEARHTAGEDLVTVLRPPLNRERALAAVA